MFLKKWLVFLTPVLGYSIGTSYSQDEIDSGKVVAHLNQVARDASINLIKTSPDSKCTLDNLSVRREWSVQYAQDVCSGVN